MTTMKELALSKNKPVLAKPGAPQVLPSGKTYTILDKGKNETESRYHDPAVSQRWHLRMILKQKLPVDITLDNGMVMHDANLVGFDTHTLILQDGEYRVIVLKHSVTTMRFKFSELEPKAGNTLRE